MQAMNGREQRRTLLDPLGNIFEVAKDVGIRVVERLADNQGAIANARDAVRAREQAIITAAEGLEQISLKGQAREVGRRLVKEIFEPLEQTNEKEISSEPQRAVLVLPDGEYGPVLDLTEAVPFVPDGQHALNRVSL